MKEMIFGIITCFAMSSALAGVILDNKITGSVVNDFEALPVGKVAGLISQTGATYGERFAGQALSTVGGFDSLSGAPTVLLTLLANPVIADNIGIFLGSSKIIYGDLGGLLGEGALSIRLSAGTDVFGVRITGSDGGPFTANFFGSEGSLLATIAQATLRMASFFGFRTTGGDRIFGVSLTNTDPDGLAYDDVTFNQLAIPEPAPLAMPGLGIAGLASRRRR